MKWRALLILAFMSGMIALLSFSVLESHDVGASRAVGLFRKDAGLFSASASELYEAVKAIDENSSTIVNAKEHLKACRFRYKALSYFTCYFFPSETNGFNAAAKMEVEEPELELVEPMGLQQIEALLFDADVLSHKTELVAQTEALYTSAKGMPALLYQFKANDRQVLESVRIELIRMGALYITGYDAPLLKTGITETLISTDKINEVLLPYLQHGRNTGDILKKQLNASIHYLSSHQDFNSFNRMEYLVKFLLPMQEQLGMFIKQQNLELNTSAYLNYQSRNMFDRRFLKAFNSVPGLQEQQLASLGKKLFFDMALSGNMKVSCATCHQPGKYFTDGIIKSPALIKDSILKRNTPTLLYAGRQHSQFWDGRSISVVDQVKDVVFNPLEMGSVMGQVVKRVKQNRTYRQSFRSLFPGKNSDRQLLDGIAVSIAAYIAKLEPMDSPFDKYINGNRTAMTTAQIKGFNLFMGKAQCATCHFVPYFNSLTPPFYDHSEMEILGTPGNDDLTHPVNDKDLGRFNLYQIRYYQQAFKTPTIRNAAKTAPYMHNGAFKTLQNVIDFYIKGGGKGIGLKTREQTLSSEPLNLTREESDQIIQFINSLTDASPANI
ncbi:cytochrome c peroxidase [Mucilaginibacter terrae]|uniref:Cytochrome c peroxidase n=1 Tax=Mucilaginibacter terrae TaxID=1955052 RepID=A0ABU3GMM2_9SPHI|nr:cytochrome c peroxidase [Mucilaginibacter terrae]MDT3400992.1 cytochrome c peroxidase [Mucilaginibacter terrae]